MGGVTMRFVYDAAAKIIVEQDENYKITATNLQGRNILFRQTGENTYSYLTDGHGDVVGLTDEFGHVLQNHTYDPFGNKLNTEVPVFGAGQLTAMHRAETEGLDNPFGYCGEYTDFETGFVYLRARYYDPATSRMLSPDTYWHPENMIYGDAPVKWNERKLDPNDPFGLNSYTYKPDINAIMQSGNLYVYCMNNPVICL